MNAHPAGPRHAEEIHHGGAPPRPRTAAEVLGLAPNVWPRNTVRGDDGVVSIAGVPVTDIAEEFGTPLFVIDEDDFRSRCRDIAAAFGGGEHVRYAAKAFLCAEIARWIDEEGLSLDVASGGELAVALHARLPCRANRLARQQQICGRADHGRQGRRRPRRARLDDRDRPPRRDRRCGGRRSGRAGARHRRRRGPHPRVHLHRARGPEVRAVAGQRRRDGRRAASLRSRQPPAGRPAQPHRIADLRRRRLRTRRAPRDRAAARRRRRVRRREDVADATVDLGGGLGISYLPSDDPPPVEDLAAKLGAIVRSESAAVGLPAPRLVVEPGERSQAPAPSPCTRSARSRTWPSARSRTAGTSASTAG